MSTPNPTHIIAEALSTRLGTEAYQAALHVMSKLSDANCNIIEIPTDITLEPEDHTWFKVRGFDYYGGTDEDMPIDQIEAQAADILAIARYRRAAAAEGEKP